MAFAAPTPTAPTPPAAPGLGAPPPHTGMAMSGPSPQAPQDGNAASARCSAGDGPRAYPPAASADLGPHLSRLVADALARAVPGQAYGSPILPPPMPGTELGGGGGRDADKIALPSLHRAHPWTRLQTCAHPFTMNACNCSLVHLCACTPVTFAPVPLLLCACAPKHLCKRAPMHLCARAPCARAPMRLYACAPARRAIIQLFSAT